jgi:RNA polymerase sigma-70 factor (ECF subfamily)
LAKAFSMAEAPITRPSLLVRIRDGRDGEAWAQFVEIYGPPIYEYGRRHGFQDADAADLTQEVLRAVAAAAATFAYNPGKGSFRSWLFTVARTKRIDLGARLARHPRASGDSAVGRRLEAVAEPLHDSEEADWDRALRQSQFDWAVTQIRSEFQESTWQAFFATMRGASPRDTARQLGMSAGAVYTARSRVLARLRRQIEQAGLDPIDP